jgi:hypothetical protein
MWRSEKKLSIPKNLTAAGILLVGRQADRLGDRQRDRESKRQRKRERELTTKISSKAGWPN